MFTADLERRLKGIFDVKRVRFEAPSESREQDTLFVEIDESRTAVTAGRESARVSGTLTMFSQREKLPYGYFSKCIERSASDLTRPLIFSLAEANEETFQNLTTRSLGFTFLYSAQYDPNHGELTQVHFGEIA